MDNIILLITYAVLNTAIWKYVLDHLLPVLKNHGIDIATSIPLEYAFMIVVIPALLVQIPIIERGYLYIRVGVRKLEGTPGMRIRTAFGIACRHAGMQPEQFNLYISSDRYINASAAGKNNIIVHADAVDKLSIPELAGLMAHEIGHLVHKDTYHSMALSWMGILPAIVLYVLSYLSDLFFLLSKNKSAVFLVILGLLGYFFAFATYIVDKLNMIPLIILMFVRILLSVNPVPKENRGEEGADHYACEIGMGMNLYTALAELEKEEKSHFKSMASNMIDNHGELRDRMNTILNYLESHR